VNASEEEERRLRAERELKKIPGVVGVGVGLKVKGRELTTVRSLRVFVEKKRPPEAVLAEERIPSVVEGLPTDVAEVGFMNFCSEDISEHDPLISGITLATAIPDPLGGHRFARGGTLGFFATAPGEDPERYMLMVSNHHVLFAGGAVQGDRVYQPGMNPDPTFAPLLIRWIVDTGSRNVVARLEDGFLGNHSFTQPNGALDNVGIDCASAKLDIRFSGTCCRTNQGVSVRNAFRSPQSNGVQAVAAVAAITSGNPTSGPLVYFVGRSNEAREGRVENALYSATLPDPRNPGATVTLDKVMLIRTTTPSTTPGATAFVADGDSGAALLDAQGRLVGLVFGGDGGDYGLACHIHPVLDRLGQQHGGALAPITAAHPAVGPAARARSDAPGSMETPNHVRELRLKLLHTELGKSVLDLVERHEEEVGALIKHERAVTVAWHRSRGPAFLNRLLANARDPATPIPDVIEGVTRAEFLRSLDAALREHGSPALQRDLELHAETLHAMEPRFESLHAVADELVAAEPKREDTRASA
jgi:hypothetical protein